MQQFARRDSRIDQQQEAEYEIPYHYLVTAKRLLSFPDRLIQAPIYLEHMNVVIERLAPFQGQRILDAGCGDGRFIAEVGGRNVEVYGTDYSERAVQFARIMNPGAKIEVGDLTARLPFAQDWFDQIVLIETLEHIPPHDLPEVIRELHRVLRPGGRIIITVPHKNRKIDSKHYQHFTSSQLREIVGAEFEVDEITGYDAATGIRRRYFGFLCALYYYIYPLKKTSIGNLVDRLNGYANAYFVNSLRDCGADDGLGLVCVSHKRAA
jgi:SAM-dependent methyltransferase